MGRHLTDYTVNVLAESHTAESWFVSCQYLVGCPSGFTLVTVANGCGHTCMHWLSVLQRAGVVMTQLQELGVRSFLLTSGTLSPMDSYAAELGILMPVRVENAHVVKPTQARSPPPRVLLEVLE